MRAALRIAGIELAAHDPRRLADFYRDAAGFDVEDAPDGTPLLRLGETELRLRRAYGRRMPEDSGGQDRWFRHVAIVVADVADVRRQALAAGARELSAGPQTLPESNPAAAGITAWYARDPEGHPFELIAYPPDKRKFAGAYDRGERILGVDHTALAVQGDAASIAFYRDRIGLEIAGESHNVGLEQERLSGVEGADVRITTLAAPGGGLGLELLAYRSPRDGRETPRDTTPDDAWFARTLLRGAPRDASLAPEGVDPEGHGWRFEP